MMTPIQSVLIRMRKSPVLLGAAIARMFMHVRMPEAALCQVQFFWREGLDKETPVKTYSYRVHLSGKSDNPYAAMKTLKVIAEEKKDTYLHFYTLSKEEILVEDLLSSCELTEEELRLREEATDCLKEGNSWEIRKWVTHCPTVLEKIPPTQRTPTFCLTSSTESKDLSEFVGTFGEIILSAVWSSP